MSVKQLEYDNYSMGVSDQGETCFHTPHTLLAWAYELTLRYGINNRICSNVVDNLPISPMPVITIITGNHVVKFRVKAMHSFGKGSVILTLEDDIDEPAEDIDHTLILTPSEIDMFNFVTLVFNVDTQENRFDFLTTTSYRPVVSYAGLFQFLLTASNHLTLA